MPAGLTRKIGTPVWPDTHSNRLKKRSRGRLRPTRAERTGGAWPVRNSGAGMEAGAKNAAKSDANCTDARRRTPVRTVKGEDTTKS